MKNIVTDITYIDKKVYDSVSDVENILKNLYGDVIRWAIAAVIKNNLKITVTYIKKET